MTIARRKLIEATLPTEAIDAASTQEKTDPSSAFLAPCTFSFHSAFEDPAAPPDAPDRWSIEVRCVALYD